MHELRKDVIFINAFNREILREFHVKATSEKIVKKILGQCIAEFLAEAENDHLELIEIRDIE